MKAKAYKKKEYIIMGSFLVVVLIVIIFIFVKPTKKDDSFHEPSYQISFLIHGDMNNALENMQKGAMKAADDFNASLHFEALDSEKGIVSEKKTIDEEIKNHTQAIIISPQMYLQAKLDSLKTPLVFAKTQVHTAQAIPYIGCDYYKIGSSLADEIIQHGNFHKKIMIFANKQIDNSGTIVIHQLQRKLKEVGNGVTVYYMDQVTKEEVQATLKKNKAGVAVAIGQTSLEEMVKALRGLHEEEKNMQMELYGIGNSKVIIKAIEDNIIVSTVIQNDYGIGYLSVQCAIHRIDKKTCKQNKEIQYAIINKENMYDKENAWMLFPLVR